MRAAALLVVAVAITGAAAGGATAGAEAPGYTTPVAGGVVSGGVVSGDGRFVGYSTGSGETARAVVRDRIAGSTTLVSRAAGGGVADGQTFVTDISADGRWLALVSNSSNLVARDLPRDRFGERVFHVYLHDRRTATTTLVSVRRDGSPATENSRGAAVADDGSVVGFASRDRHLVEREPEPTVYLSAYVRDVAAGVTARVPARLESDLQALTPDGRFVLYVDGTLTFPGHNGFQLWRWDRRSGATAQVSVAGGEDLGRFVTDARSSADGRHVVFHVQPQGSGPQSWRRDMQAPEAVRRGDNRLPVALSRDGRIVLDVVTWADASGTTGAWSLVRGDDVLLTRRGFFDGASVSDDLRHLAFVEDGVLRVHDVGLQYPCNSGYRLVASDGGVFAFGDATFHGSTGSVRLNRPIVAAMSTPSNRGYWLVASDGGVFSFGDARFRGSTGNLRLASPIVDAAATPGGDGYWLLAADGGVFAFGGARFHGRRTFTDDEASAIVASPAGAGYWIVARDGHIAAFGDAAPLADTPGGNIVAAVATPTGKGAWVAAADGDVFASGDARALGGGPKPSNAPIVDIAASPTGRGYRLVAADGGVFSFGDARFCGSTGAITLNRPIVAAAG